MTDSNKDPGTPLTLNLPFPVRCHPAAAEIESNVLTWAEEFGLTPTPNARALLAGSRFGQMAAYAYPTASLPDAEWAAAWITWLFLLDDQLEEGAYGTEYAYRPVIEAVSQVLRSQDTKKPGAPLIRALADLNRQLVGWATPVWKRRWAAHTINSLKGALQETRLRDRAVPPSLAEYTMLGRISSASLPVFDTVELCAGVHLSDTAYRHPSYQKIVMAAADVFCWGNDLCSVDKEADCGIVTNLVRVLEHHQQMSRTDAVHAARTLIRQRADDLAAACDAFSTGSPYLGSAPHSGSAERASIEQAVTALCAWLGGTLWWHTAGTTIRYRPHTTGSTVPPDLLHHFDRTDNSCHQADDNMRRSQTLP